MLTATTQQTASRRCISVFVHPAVAQKHNKEVKGPKQLTETRTFCRDRRVQAKSSVFERQLLMDNQDAVMAATA